MKPISELQFWLTVCYEFNYNGSSVTYLTITHKQHIVVCAWYYHYLGLSLPSSIEVLPATFMSCIIAELIAENIQQFRCDLTGDWLCTTPYSLTQ